MRDKSAWTSARDASLRLGISIYELHRRALAGEIRTLIEPGRPVKFRVSDIDRLSREAESAPSAS
jgi:predicted site-specific integrase-resolvase